MQILFRKMQAFLLFNPTDEIIFQQLDLFTNYSQYCVPCVLICLLISYCVYSRVVWSFLEDTKIPKLYKITTLHSLWMGSTHLIISILCFSQLSTLVHPLSSTKSSHPVFMDNILYAATANICQHSTECNGSILNSKPSKDPVEYVAEIEWTAFNAISMVIIYAVLIQEILLASRNKMSYILYSRLFGLTFLASAIRTRCPLLSIQGAYLMSINTTSKEIARALVAWKSYSQEDSDRRPSPVAKVVTFVFFVCHMVIWFSLMLYYMPFFIHKLPSITERDPSRLFLAYAYMSLLAYLVLETVTSPLFLTIRCMGWCRRSSGITWRILALSDCHLLGHYSPLVLKLYNIQVMLDQRKALFRNKMVQKHLASLEGSKRKPPSNLQAAANRPANLLAAVKTVVALKRKIQRRMGEVPARSLTLEDIPQLILQAEDSNIETDPLDKEVEIALVDSRQDSGTLKIGSEEIPEPSDEVKKEFTIEKDEANSIGIEATLLKEGEQSLADQGTFHRLDSADVVQD